MAEALLQRIGSLVWGPPMLAVFLGVGLFLTVRLRFFQLLHPLIWLRETFFALFRNPGVRKTQDTKAISQYQALSSALAACMGTGNIVGVATAICAGGPGAVFWMLVSAILGMITAFAENTLGVLYRYKDTRGEWMGGAFVYLERGLGMKRTARIFCVLLAVSAFGVGNMTQTNAIAVSLEEVFGIAPAATGIVVAMAAALVVMGGIRRIASVAEKLIPALSLVFIAVSLLVIVHNIHALPGVVRLIVQEAFAWRAAAGGVAGFGIAKAMRFGVARGVFSNEAGLGSSAIIHAAAEVDRPAVQGMWGIFEVFLDTVVMCSVTALTILCSGVWTPNTQRSGAALSADAFSGVLGKYGAAFVCVSVALFAFATLIGWSYYGKRGVQYLFGSRADTVYHILYIGGAFLGCIANLEVVWTLSDIFNALMAIPNLLAVVLLSGKVKKELERVHTTRLPRRR